VKVLNDAKEISLDNILPDPDQPRKRPDEAKIEELAESIKMHGLLQPILVRSIGNGRFQLVYGERRFKACKQLGLKNIRAEVRDFSDKEALETQLVENLQREDLNPIDEAETFQRMIVEFHYTHKEIALRIGKSREYVTNALRLLRLPNVMKEAIGNEKITRSHARILLPLDNTKQKEVLAEILSHKLSVKETKELVNKTENVSRETYGISEDGLVIGIWVSEQIFHSLSDLADSEKTTVEKLCSKIIQRGVVEWKK